MNAQRRYLTYLQAAYQMHNQGPHRVMPTALRNLRTQRARDREIDAYERVWVGLLYCFATN